jgi:hypothetical protein
VGAGGDFCSREHRNQYGLRLGMDRLQEANKVATLMRRRENLKTVVPAQAESLASLLRRGFNQSLRLSEPAAPAQHMRDIQPALDAHVRGGGTFFLPQPRGTREKHVARTCGYLRVIGQRLEAILPELREHTMTVTVPPARSARLLDGSRSLKGRRRGFPLPRRRSARTVLPDESQREPLGGATYQRDAAPPLWLDLPIEEGRPVPAQGSQRMRPPERQLRGLPAALRKAELVWPGAMAPPVFIQEGLESGARTPVIMPMLRAVALPHGPRHTVVPGMGHGGAQKVARSLRDTNMNKRGAEIVWTGSNLPPIVLASGHSTEAHLRAAAWSRGDTRKVSQTPRTSELAPRFSTVSFEPQEAPFGYSGFKIQSGMPALPVSQAATPKSAQKQPQSKLAKQQIKPMRAEAIRLEDRFDAGLGNWVGGVADWKVDVAGVRPGALALFAPSLGMADYDLEFLVRIDQKSLSWVFRAADEQNYHLATISNSPQGRTFTRSSVIEDQPGLSVTTPVRQAGNPKSAVTIHTRVRGNDFTVSMDGEPIERWSDNRLSIGGVGFTGGPEQKARLYWMRLTSDASDR